MIKNVVFDLGNVLLEFKPLEYLRDNIHDEEIVQSIYKNLFRGEEWINLDSGSIDEEKAIEAISSRIPKLSEKVRHYMYNWPEILKPMKETIDALRLIKQKNYNTLILSNFHGKAFRYVVERNEFFKFFNGGVISYEVGLLKPNKEIYEELINKYGISPEETIFIDDMLPNINAAKDLGFNVILFESPEQLLNELSNYDIIP